MNRLLQGIENEPCMRRGADAPADDAAGIGVAYRPVLEGREHAGAGLYTYTRA